MVVDNTVQWLQLNLKETGLPVGFEYFTMNPNIPAGSLPLQGGLYSRLAYPDLWEWVQKQSGYLKAESEWQELAVSNGGNVPFYSSGDGSTTFRVPSLKCWVKGASSISEVSEYLAAALPNIEGQLGLWGTEKQYSTTSGAFSTNNGALEYGGGHIQDAGLIADFNASLSNPIYGASDTVQPPSIVGLWCVKAYGTVTNVGSTDVAAIAQGLTRVENKLNEAAIVGTVIPYAGTSFPTGYLPCNGAAISRETYASLFAVIGTTYGDGDGSTTFNLPNLNNSSFLEGSNTVGTVKDAGLPNIKGGTTNGYSCLSTVDGSNGAIYMTGSDTGCYGGNLGASLYRSNFAIDASRYSSIYRNDITTVQPKSVTVKFCIKY